MSHSLKGRAQSPEYAKRRDAALRGRAAMSPEKVAAWKARISANNGSGRPEARAKNAAAHRGRTPWNKGNNWRDKLTPEQVRAVNAERARRRRMNSDKERIHGRMSALVRKSLKNGKRGASWPSLVGYDMETLVRHLRTTIPEGYCWYDYISGELELDHVVPFRAFNFKSADDEDFRRCWALSNLRLIHWRENYDKRDKLLRPFQPSLLALGS